eukprot:1097061-Pelagomonas_calceolata.AAC.1
MHNALLATPITDYIARGVQASKSSISLLSLQHMLAVAVQPPIQTGAASGEAHMVEGKQIWLYWHTC